MPPVADKYRPVSRTPTTTDRPRGVILSVWLLAGFLCLWSPSTLMDQLLSQEESPLAAPLQSGVAGLESASRVLGFASARSAVYGLVAPLHSVTRLLELPPPPLEEPTPPPEPPPVVEVDLPGERWIGPADPRSQRPKRILIVGASSIQYYLGTELERRLELYDDVAIHRRGKLGTGLSRPDVFDWPAEVQKLMAQHRSDIVVAQFGGNDAQPITLESGRRVYFGSDSWNEEYTRRLRALVQQIVRDGALPIFVGMPPMREPGFSGRMGRLNDLTERVVREEGGRYVPTWDIAGDHEGAYRLEVAWRGRRVPMRMKDGIHYTREGSQYVADQLVHRLEAEFSLVPTEATLAPMVSVELPAGARGEPTRWTAMVPRTVPAEGLPLIYFLHGATGSWRDWPQHAHRQLQELAEANGLIFVFPDGGDAGWYLDAPLVDSHRFRTYFFDEVFPSVEGTLPWNGQAGVIGLSMGGHGALTFALTEPGRFESLSSMSGVTDIVSVNHRELFRELLGPYAEDTAEAWNERSALQLLEANPDALRGVPLRLSCGQSDFWFGANARFSESLAALGIEHVWDPKPGNHDWDFWLAELPLHVAWHAENLKPEAVMPEEEPPVEEPSSEPSAD